MGPVCPSQPPEVHKDALFSKAEGQEEEVLQKQGEERKKSRTETAAWRNTISPFVCLFFISSHERVAPSAGDELNSSVDIMFPSGS